MSVLIVRDDGVIVVPNAVPWPTGLARVVDHLLDALGIPPRDHRDQQHNDEREDPTCTPPCS